MIRATDVSKALGDSPLLAPVDLEARPGECLVLRGPNGSGKTTLLRILAGTVPASTGEARLDGELLDERTQHTRSQVAALLGPSTTYRDLTLGDHLVLVDSTWGGDPAGAWARAETRLASLEIGHLAKRFPHELSSGQQQLFQLALVLHRPSAVLLLDEPEQRLDTHKRELLTALLGERLQAGTVLVIACHDPVMTEELADYVLDLGEE
ncbi:MAG TPA: ABC transporter ATP-binding protein [Segeticoccus sp.]|nr:ABC transporter ATP-binding protein [Segeticoccus sp.]